MKTCVLFLCFIALQSIAQSNLVRNPGFEKGENKGFGVQKIKGKANEIDYWAVPVGDPELYMTPKKSVAVANSGRNAIGLILGGSKQEKTKFEYVTGKLATPLKAGETYCIQLSTILHRTSKWAASDVGIILHNESGLISEIPDPTTLTASLYLNKTDPVMNTKWSEYSGYYVATGGEQYISLGKFGDSPSVELKTLEIDTYFQLDGFQSKAYYQIDDVNVTLFSPEMDCGCAEPILEEEEKLETVQSPYLFALDGSGSMKNNGLFDTLRQNLVRFVDDVPLGTPVSFVTFAASSKKIFAGKVTKNTSFQVDSLLANARIGGGTNVYVGLQLAYESWDEPGVDSAKIVLISDGAFNVTNKIVDLVKRQYETKGRKLTIVQIGARAPGLEKLKPYMDDYIHTTQAELEKAVTALNRKKRVAAAAVIPCVCEEEFSDTMNYHFVIDYSGSMKKEKTRAIMALSTLFEQAPDNAMISITAFNTRSEKLYVGKKTDITMAKLALLLSAEYPNGGTDPTPGIKDALVLAESMSINRFSHVILITDLKADLLSKYLELGESISQAAERIDLAAHAITVSDEGFVTTYAQFDVFSKRYAGVSRSKFDNDLFKTNRSSCNYTSQQYHFNPAKAAMKAGSKRVASRMLRRAIENQIGI